MRFGAFEFLLSNQISGLLHHGNSNYDQCIQRFWLVLISNTIVNCFSVLARDYVIADITFLVSKLCLAEDQIQSANLQCRPSHQFFSQQCETKLRYIPFHRCHATRKSDRKLGRNDTTMLFAIEKVQFGKNTIQWIFSYSPPELNIIRL